MGEVDVNEFVPGAWFNADYSNCVAGPMPDGLLRGASPAGLLRGASPAGPLLPVFCRPLWAEQASKQAAASSEALRLVERSRRAVGSEATRAAPAAAEALGG